MSERIKQLGIDRLTASERLELLQEIWDSLEADFPDAELTSEQQAEIDRRISAHQGNPGAAVPWEQVEAEALARIRQ